MSKKKKTYWEGYKKYTLSDGTKFYARDDSDAKLYREKVGDVKWSPSYQIQEKNWNRFALL